MLPSGSNNPMGGGQSASPSLLRSNSGMLGGQASTMNSQSGFPPLMSQHMQQYGNMNFLANVPNVSPLLNQPYGGGGLSSGLSGLGGNQRVGMNPGAESDSLAGIGNGMAFTPSTAFHSPSMRGLSTSNQNQGQQFHNSAANQLMQDQQHSHQVDSHNFPQSHQGSVNQFSSAQNSQHPQQQFQVHRNGLGGVGHVKLEPQASNDHQQGHNSRNNGPVKMETQIQGMRSLPPIKMEQQHPEQSFIQQQQQQHQQQLLQLARQSPQSAAAQMNLLSQQRLMQMSQQQHQQHNQQLLKTMPPQRSSIQSQFPTQNMPLRAPIRPTYEPGTCARRLTQYMYQQQHRPEDNNIEFWRKFVAEYFAPHAKKKWCVSMYGNGRQTTGVFPQDVWHCEICNRIPGRGFEATVEVLPRLFKIKYESGTLEELLYVDMPREYQNSAGQIVLDYAKAIQESVFDQLRVVRDGRLRIVFNLDLKICSWEFCAWRHEELMPRRLLIPQVSQLGIAAQKYQAASQNASSSLSIPELQNNCNMFVSSARQLAKALEVPLVNDLGYTKRYVRCLQISEVVNSMKDLIDYSRETGTGPMESLTKFPRRTNALSNVNDQGQQHEDQQLMQQQQQTVGQSSNNASSAMQLPIGNGTPSANTIQAQATTPSSSTIAGLLHQNSMNSKQPSALSNANSPYGGSTNQVPSPGSSSTMPAPAQPNSSPFNSPTPSSNNLQAASHGALTSANYMSAANPSTIISTQQSAHPVEAEPNEQQSSVQKIIQDMLNSSQATGNDGMIGVGSMVSDLKTTNLIPQLNSNSSLNGMLGNGSISNNHGNIGPVFGSMGGIGPNLNGIRAAMSNHSVPMNGRMGLASIARDRSLNHQQHDLGNQLLNGLGAVNGFNNLQFDWKSLP